jgi:acetyltransferase-like isoleucine patch superfamily enzyme
VRDHVHVGSDVTVAMGSVVIDDLIDGSTVFGIPARPRVARRAAWSYGEIE